MRHILKQLQPATDVCLTWRISCSSLLPLTGLCAGLWVTLDFRKPPATTISTHTARSWCCLLRLLIILSLLSERDDTNTGSWKLSQHHRPLICLPSLISLPVCLNSYGLSGAHTCRLVLTSNRWSCLHYRDMALHRTHLPLSCSIGAQGSRRKWSGPHLLQQIQHPIKSREEGAEMRVCKQNYENSKSFELNYLNVQLSGQKGSTCAAQAAEEAVQESDGLIRTLSPKPAPLVHESLNS